MKKFSMQWAACLAILFSLASCDLDYNELTADLTGDTHFGFERFDASEIALSNDFIGPIQSNNQALNPLGIYNDPIFGKTKAHFVTQVDLSSTSTVVGSNITISKVTLKVPYFSKWLAYDVDGNSTYKLDSIHNPEGKMGLKIYRSGYFLNSQDYEDGSLISARYYSNQTDILNDKIGSPLNNSTDTAQNTQFFFDKSEYREDVIDEDGEVTSTLREAPGMRVELNKNIFLGLLQAAPANAWTNSQIFKNYFRGLIFEVDETSPESPFALLNFGQGTIDIEYSDAVNVNGTKITLKLAGNSVSIIERENDQPTQQDDRFFLKGGANGYVASLDLFGPDVDNNGKPDMIDTMINEGWIINEANLEVNIDQNQMQDKPIVPRLTLYDLNNNRPILDYFYDNSTALNTKLNKYIYNGIVEKESNGQGLRYKIRMTNHLKSLIQLDSTNVKLGLVVTEDINSSYILRTFNPTPNWNDYVPVGHFWHPYGTVLYGPNIAPASPDYNKRLKLNIYYSKPD